MEYVFVYGTLMKNERNHHLINDDDFVDAAKLENYYMFNLGTYPGISKGEGNILGEVYSVDEITLKRLDYLEDEGTLYKKVKVNVILSNNTVISAYAYVYILNKIENKFNYNVYKWKEIKKV